MIRPKMLVPQFKTPPEGASVPHAWVVVGDMVISATQEGFVPEHVWIPFVADLSAPTTKRVLGLAIGSITIHSKQRRSAAQAMHDKRVAAVVGSSVARGIATALGWMGLKLRAFDWDNLEGALSYLEPPNLTTAEGLEIIEELLARTNAR
ncbi:MAG TPA: hypothetical protein VK034_20345, partial [Enhygromyxa sp.]|nr:hypothetical protein [Enhygromyxa sp.]